jgi:4-azaleucine resistance transporter AzlC
MNTTPSQEFLLGVRDELPILVGVIPFGMIYGVLALSVGMDTASAQAMSAIIFAGSAQLMTVQLVAIGTPAAVLIITGFVINLRHALYSASVAPYVRHLNPAWKGMLAYLLTDEAYAVTITHYQQEGDQHHRHWYFLGAGLALWTSWQISTAVGVFLGAQVPASWGLEFTLALTFIALVVPQIKDRPSLLAALTAGAVSVLAAGLSYRLGLLTAGLAGIMVGLWSEQRWK